MHRLDAYEKFHMGGTGRKIGPPLSFPARRTPPLLYHIEASLSIDKMHKKKESFSTLFFDAVGRVDYSESLVALEAGAQLGNCLTSSACGVKDFVFGRTAIGAFNFHSITTSSILNRQGCIHRGTAQRNCHPRNSYSRPHRPQFPVRCAYILHSSNLYSS